MNMYVDALRTFEYLVTAPVSHTEVKQFAIQTISWLTHGFSALCQERVKELNSCHKGCIQTAEKISAWIQLEQKLGINFLGDPSTDFSSPPPPHFLQETPGERLKRWQEALANTPITLHEVDTSSYQRQMEIISSLVHAERVSLQDLITPTQTAKSLLRLIRLCSSVPKEAFLEKQELGSFAFCTYFYIFAHSQGESVGQEDFDALASEILSTVHFGKEWVDSHFEAKEKLKRGICQQVLLSSSDPIHFNQQLQEILEEIINQLPPEEQEHFVLTFANPLIEEFNSFHLPELLQDNPPSFPLEDRLFLLSSAYLAARWDPLKQREVEECLQGLDLTDLIES